MSVSPKLVTIFGGSGFLGRYIARRMAKDGWRVRVACRRPNEAGFVRTYGVVGQVEPILANIRDEASTEAAIAGADAVINCVAILNEQGKQTFDALHVDGADRIARLSAKHGVSNLVHISALGADPDSDSDSARTKAEGEAAVTAAFPSAVILRPSVMFGTEDEFFNRFASMARMGPVLPLVGANSRFQPVYVDDVAQAAVLGAQGEAAAGIYELGGPKAAPLSEIIGDMLDVIRRRRLVVNMPFFKAGLMAKSLDLLQFLSFGLFSNTILTADQVKQLRNDNVVADDAKSFADLGIQTTDYMSVLDDYLYRHRPNGQFTELTESARNMRSSASSSEF